MQIHNVIQGSDQWHRLRTRHYTASEAAAMMGASKHQSRSDLLREKATGATAEVSRQQQAAFDRGHEAEAAARPIAERIIGEELYPVTASEEIDGLPLLASCDGLTMLGDYGWENKLYNDELVAQIERGALDWHYVWQLEQQIAVTGVEAILFMASDGTEERCVSMWYYPQEGLRDNLIKGWQQFAQDLADYQPSTPDPEPTGTRPEDLPALRIAVRGEVTDSNLEAFRDHARSVIQSINTDLQTDEDFATADKTSRWCKEVEQRLDAAKEQALSQTESIDRLFRTIDEIREETRQTRLDLEKKVKARKQQIRENIQGKARQALNEHIREAESELGIALPKIEADFAGAMKSKRTVKSLQDAADEELARAKLAVSEERERVGANLTRFDELASGYDHLFPDRASLVLKDREDIEAQVRSRIAEEERRLEAEREKAREAERQKAQEDERQASALEEAADQGAEEPAKAEATPSPEHSIEIIRDVPWHVGLTIRVYTDRGSNTAEQVMESTIAKLRDAGFDVVFAHSAERQDEEAA